MEASSNDIALAKKHPEAGPLLQAFRPPGAVPAIGAVLILLGGGVLYYNIYRQMGGAPAAGPAGTVMMIAALVVLVVGFVMVVLPLGMRVRVCEGGVIVAENRKDRVIPWADVAGVFDSMQGAVPVLAAIVGRRVAIETKDGETVSVAGSFYRDCYRVAEALVDRIRPQAFQAAQERLGRGEAVAFGKRVALTPEAIHWDGKPVPWGRVQGVGWGTTPAATGRVSCDTDLALTGPDGPRAIFAGDVPNVPILLDLLESRFGVPVTRTTGGFF